MRCAAVLLLSMSFLVPSATAQSLDTFVIAVGGDSNGPGCSTYAPPPPVLSFFQGGHGVSIPLPGLIPCNIAGDLRSQTAGTGPLADAMALSTSWNGNTLVANTTVYVDYGALASQSGCVYSGTTNSTSVKGSESLGVWADQLTVTSPSVSNGQAGSLRLLMSVQGGLSITGNAIADLELAYYTGTIGPFNIIRCQATNPGQTPFLISATGNGLAGFTLTPGAMSGSDVVDTLPIPFTYGTPIALRVGMMTYAIPTIHATTDSSFQAYLTGVLVLGPQGQPVTDFQIASASGTPYGAGGLLPVSYCTAGTSAAGCRAQISGSGTPSATSGSGFTLTAAGAEGNRSGLFFYGASGRQAAPWGNGTSLQCVVPPVKRGNILAGSGTTGLCNGVFAMDLNARLAAKPGHNPGAGAVMQAQLWYRDPLNTSNQKTSLSDALEFLLRP